MPQILNPYRTFLDNQDPQVVIGDTTQTLRELMSRLTSEKLAQSYAPGKWTAREILCHLADCEIAFAFRWRQAIAETAHVIQPFDQEAWAAQYAGCDAGQAVETFSALRGWNLAFLKPLPPEVMGKRVTHPERGQMTFKTMLEITAGHDLNHLSQLERIADQG